MGVGIRTEGATGDVVPWVVRLVDDRADDPTLAGAKAANLARATHAGLPVLPGDVITPWLAERVATVGVHGLAADQHEALRATWRRLSADGSRALVVRSSSTVEDGETSSMAGRFTSVLDVRTWSAFAEAVETVVASRDGAGRPGSPMAVLVQPMLVPRTGGVMFGIDPVSGRTDRLVVAAVTGGPDQLVSGVATGSRHLIDHRGRVVEAEGEPRLTRSERRALAELAGEVADLFGGPQDVEWAFDDAGHLHLLQSRPVTAAAKVASRQRGPVLGTGPVAETFPDRLAPLEVDLWLDPLRDGIALALVLSGAASRRRVGHSPVAVSVGGWAAVDLELLEPAGRRRGFALLDPRPPARRLLAAWRIGRLRAALPALVDAEIAEVDRLLAEVPPLGELDDLQLLEVLHRSRSLLVGLHGHEVLAGLLVADDAVAPTGASTGLAALGRARAAGLADPAIAAAEPAVLALVPPRIGLAPRLPQSVPAVPGAPPTGRVDGIALARELARMRVRWVQELGARTAFELGRRLAAAHRLAEPFDVRRVPLAALTGAVREGHTMVPVPDVCAAPLPARFRLSPEGDVVPVAERARGRRRSAAGARGAGGGRGQGPVVDSVPAPAGAVLVVRHLDPGLAPHLPGLAGLVAETGSELSHLAILARELGVPTVVGLAGATAELTTGTVVVVDGGTGEVRRVDGAPPTSPAPVPSRHAAPGSTRGGTP
jgi:rifampicin phosphotransferase